MVVVYYNSKLGRQSAHRVTYTEPATISYDIHIKQIQIFISVLVGSEATENFFEFDIKKRATKLMIAQYII